MLQQQSFNIRDSPTFSCISFDYGMQKSSPEDLVFDLFKLPQREEASIGKLISVLKGFGLRVADDPRLRPTMERVRELQDISAATVGESIDEDIRHCHLNRQLFRECIHPCIPLISQVGVLWVDFLKSKNCRLCATN